MMYWTDGSWGWGGWLLMTLSMALFWGLIAWVAVMLVRAVSTRPAASSSDPESVLANRFAQGEIDDDEYERRSQLLRQQRSR